MENELRLGNLFILRGKIVEFDDKLMHSVIYGGLEGSEPIPLTEEWLVRFGFEKKENSLFTKKLEYIYNSLKYCDDYKIWIYYNDDNDAACNAIADLNYVHELQNLYFALTKEELTMK